MRHTKRQNLVLESGRQQNSLSFCAFHALEINFMANYMKLDWDFLGFLFGLRLNEYKRHERRYVVVLTGT